MNKNYITLCLFLLFVNIFSQESLANNTNKKAYNESYEEDEASKKYFKVAADCLLRNVKDELSIALQRIYNRTRDDIFLTFHRMSQYSYDPKFQNLLEKCKKFALLDGKRRFKKKAKKVKESERSDCEGDFNYITGTVIENLDDCLSKKNRTNETGIPESYINLETGNRSDDKRIINKMKQGPGKEELENFIKNEIVRKNNKTNGNETKVNKKKVNEKNVNETKVNQRKVNETKVNDKKDKEKNDKRKLHSFIKKLIKKTRNLKY